MILSSAATMPQLGLVVHAATVIGAEKTFAAVRICACDSNCAGLSGKSAAKSAAKSVGFALKYFELLVKNRNPVDIKGETGFPIPVIQLPKKTLQKLTGPTQLESVDACSRMPDDELPVCATPPYDDCVDGDAFCAATFASAA